MRSRASAPRGLRIVLFAVLTLILSLTTGSAMADPGNGQGKGQDKKAASATESAPAPGPPTHSNGKSAKHQDTAVATSPAPSTVSSAVSSSPAAGNSDKGKSKVVSGETGKPQPKSNADLNPGGANNGGDCGSYCSTRDGTLSGNGQGKNGIEAGSKGRADNKNPPGQFKDGSDANNGYECDGNNGIAKGNPAHTGCVAGGEEPPPEECPPGSDNPAPPCDDQPGAECPDGSDNMTPPCDDQPGAECPDGSDNMTPPCDDTDVQGSKIPSDTAVLGTKVAGSTGAAVLARTGVEAGGLALMGGLLLAAGAAGLAASRRRSEA